MNEDAYAEWLVKRKAPPYAIPLKVLMVILCIISVFLALNALIGIIVLVLAGAASYYVFTNLSVEFEYLFVEGDLTIDRILARSRRKKLLECKKDEIQIVAPSDSYVLKDYEKGGMKITDCSSRQAGARRYALIYQRGPECVKVIFEPNDRVLHAMWRAIPSKVVR